MFLKTIRHLPVAASASLLIGCALSPAQSNAAAATSSPPIEAGAPALAEDAVSERARAALAASGIATDGLRLIHREGATFRDSSLGCGRPGTMAAQVMLEGYAVRFARGHDTYEVHVTDKYAIVCGRALESGLKMPTHSAVRGKNLDVMINDARADLATRLGVQSSDVVSQNVVPAAWTDHDLGCANASTQPDGAVRGFRLFFLVRGAAYVYHTDLVHVMACPPIEAQ